MKIYHQSVTFGLGKCRKSPEEALKKCWIFYRLTMYQPLYCQACDFTALFGYFVNTSKPQNVVRLRLPFVEHKDCDRTCIYRQVGYKKAENALAAKPCKAMYLVQMGQALKWHWIDNGLREVPGVCLE